MTESVSTLSLSFFRALLMPSLQLPKPAQLSSPPLARLAPVGITGCALRWERGLHVPMRTGRKEGQPAGTLFEFVFERLLVVTVMNESVTAFSKFDGDYIRLRKSWGDQCQTR